MKLYAAAGGELIRFLKDESEEQSLGIPAVFAELLEFDGETNTPVVAGLDTNWNAHRLSGGVLTRDGVPLVIAPDSPLTAERKQLATIRQGLGDYLTDASLDAYLDNPSPTQAQSLAVIKGTVRAVRLIIRLLALVMDYYLKRGVRT